MAHVEKRGQRRYRARYYGPDGKERSRTFATKHEAERFLTSVEHAKDTGTYVDPTRARMTVGEWGAKWLASRVKLTPKTVAGYESLWRTRIAPRWVDVPLVCVTFADVEAWVASMSAESLSASRIRQAFHLFSSMLDAAARDRRLASNPAKGVGLPRLPESEKRYLDHDQVAQLARATGDYELLVLVLAYCGLRYGEAADLRIRRVDMLRRRLSIVQAMTTISGRAVFGDTKTHQNRSVPFPAFLHAQLAAHIADRAPDDFVFAAPRGGVLRENDFRRRYFDRACVVVGFGEMIDDPNGRKRYVGFTPHELRHTAASLAIAARANIKVVQTMLGHKSATMTWDLYGHLYDDDLNAVAERIDAAARAATLRRSSRQRVAVGDNLRPGDGLGVVSLDARRAEKGL